MDFTNWLNNIIKNIFKIMDMYLKLLNKHSLICNYYM